MDSESSANEPGGQVGRADGDALGTNGQIPDVMSALVLHGVGDLRLEDRAVPTAGTDEILVRVTAVGICGSDLHYVTHGSIGPFVLTDPMVIGHEPAGVIVAVGPGVDDARLGQRVSIEPGRPCLACPQCLGGTYNLCPDMAFFATPPYDGSLCDYVVVHEAFAHQLPDALSDEDGALLEPLSVAIWACRRGRVGVGSHVLVLGAGPVGLLAVQVARAFGATEILVADRDETRLALALELGATGVWTGTGAPEVLIECSGSAAALRQLFSSLALGGRVVLVGAGADEITLPLGPWQARELEVMGLFRYANTWPAAIELVSTGRVDLRRLVTHRLGLAESVESLKSGAPIPGSIKTVVRP